MAERMFRNRGRGFLNAPNTRHRLQGTRKVITAGSVCVFVLLVIKNFDIGATRTQGAYSSQGCWDYWDTITREDSNSTASENATSTYTASSLENYFVDNMIRLGYDKESEVEAENPTTCDVWKNPFVTDLQTFGALRQYMKSLDEHTEAVEAFQPIPDLLKVIQSTNSHDVCKLARPHQKGLLGIFPDGGKKYSHGGTKAQLSHTSTAGYIEPLLPPMRHFKLCTDRAHRKEHIMNMNYLVHDFEAMCRNLKPHSKRVLIDIGASLDFHADKGKMPIIWLMELYEKFGFHFDHIYGFESNFADPKDVYGKYLPQKYMPKYHWINVGVKSDEDAKLNPLNSIVKQFTEDDLVIVKLDIDTSFIELPLAKQLLEDKDDIYHRIVDQFYFEHHVHLRDMMPAWKKTTGTIKDSFDLFQGLRKKGIPAHFWP